jgi:hypothetical protein
MALEPIKLNLHKDTIRWKWTSSRDFFVASAYDIQFKWSFNPYPATPVWQAYAQPRCKFFVWLVMRDRILTTNNMIKKIGYVITTAPYASAYMKPLITC